MEYKIDFKNFWPDFNKENNWFTVLFKNNNINYSIVDKDPDIIIYSVFKHIDPMPQNLSKSTRLVFYTGENWRPDHNADFNITFDHEEEYNNTRLPIWITFGCDKNFQLKKQNKEKFCCFVYSNPVDFRNKFCLDLSQYRQVDCGGNCLNNTNAAGSPGWDWDGGGRGTDGNWAENKLEFQKQYKFCIAYENSAHPGYVTEKILHAYQSNCIPIYYGSERIVEDFNKETFINAHDFNSNEELIKYIKHVDEDEELYNSYLNKPIFSDYWIDIFSDPEEKFFKDICNKILGV